MYTEEDARHVYCDVFICISYVRIFVLLFCQSDESDESDESSEEGSTTDNTEESLSDGKKF